MMRSRIEQARIKRAYWIAVLCTGIWFTATVSASHAQELAKLYVEELQEFPDDGMGTWRIGDRDFVAGQDTVLPRDIAPRRGSITVVIYVERDGNYHASYIVPQPILATDVNDGPYVTWLDETTAEVVSIERGEVFRQVEENVDAPRTIKDLRGPVNSITIDPTVPEPDKSAWEAPERWIAISDLEGHYDNAVRFLQANEVINTQNEWSFGDGHLVLIGDLVDRGSSVTELQWLIKRLAREAAAQGGHVHYVLGNHEVMVMAGDLRYIDLKYQFISDRLGTTYDQLFSEKTELGRWWRTRNGVTQIGEVIFVHAGYSPALDRARLDLDTLNRRIRSGLPPAQPEGLDVATNPVVHQDGPLWYRGYFAKHAIEWGGQATEAEIQRILNRHDASHIAIGHTLVEQVGPLDSSGQVIAIDVEWHLPDAGQGLLYENGRLFRLNMRGDKQPLFERD